MPDIDNSKLLPCPFCGKIPRLHEYSYHETPTVLLYCVICYCVEMSSFNDAESAIKKWNSRADIKVENFQQTANK